MQERLTAQIANAIIEAVNPKGVAVLIEAVKEQQTEISVLQNQVKDQAVDMNELKASVANMYELLNIQYMGSCVCSQLLPFQ